MSPELNLQENISIMNAVLTGYEYIECLDRIEKTRYYRQNIKQSVKSLSAQLCKTNALHELTGIDDMALIQMMKGKERLMQKIAVIRPELKFGLDMILTQYFDNPIETLGKLGIEVEI